MPAKVPRKTHFESLSEETRNDLHKFIDKYGDRHLATLWEVSRTTIARGVAGFGLTHANYLYLTAEVAKLKSDEFNKSKDSKQMSLFEETKGPVEPSEPNEVKKV